MEPQILYVTSADGTRIAVWKLGHGRPLLVPHSIWVTSMESFWHIPQEREGLEQLAQRHMVVRFDNRGYGLSERDVSDFSLNARVSDLAAVVSHLGSSPVDLVAPGNSATIAIAFAVANPDKIRRLVLWAAYARVRDFRPSPTDRVLRHLIDIDWQAYVRTQAALNFGWNDVGLKLGEMSADGVAPEVFVAALQALRDYDVTDLLPQVRCPTLVMHQRGNARIPISASKHLASTISNARLVQFEQESSLVGGAGVQIIDEFLDEDEPRAESATPLPSGTAVIFFADIVDSTGLTERLGDTAFREKARGLDQAMQAAIRDNGGTAVEGKTLGDGVLAVFTSAKQAIACARVCHEAAGAAGLALHAGIHAGDVIREADPDGRSNVYGGAVNIAARIAAASSAGETLVSATVRELARTSAGVTFEDRGEHALKGIDDPVRVWVVRKA